MRRLIAASFFAVAAAAGAFATPTDDVANAFTKLGTATSYHMAVQTAQGGSMDIDMVPPEKMHATMAQVEMIRVAGATYVKVNGNWMKLPSAVPQMAAQMGAVSYIQSVGNNPKQAQVEDLGMKTVDGASYHAYKVTPADGKPSTLYVDASGLPARVDVTEPRWTSIVRFTKYNAPLSIDAQI
jgi:hypothetical protein